MTPKVRADQLAFEQGLAESREGAKRLIMAARIVLAGDVNASLPPVVVPKPGQLYADGTLLALLPGKDYVSRGAFKLLTILDSFHLDMNGLVCLDAGASTGGFTDCLLRRGARRVYAVDVGKNQLHEKLRRDSRVISMEGVNLRYARADLLSEMVDFITGDLSFISLTLVLPTCMQWLKAGGKAALLIKPQFELGPEKTHKGVVRKEEDRLTAVSKIVSFCQEQLKMRLLGVMPAQIKGPKGNQEYMALFEKADQ